MIDRNATAHALRLGLVLALASLSGAAVAQPGDPIRAIHAAARPLDAHVDVLMPTTPGIYRTDDGVSQVTVDKLVAGGMATVTLAIQSPTGPATPEGIAKARAEVDAKLARIHALVDGNPDRLALALTSADIDRIHAAGKIAVLISFQNAYALGTDGTLVGHYVNEGVRVFAFNHAGNNAFADSSRPTTPGDEPNGGLSALGRAAVATLNDRGVVIDVSQLTPRALLQTLELSRAPVIASHSAVRALVDETRNLSDAELDAMAAKGGVVHVPPFNTYLAPRPPEFVAKLGAIRTGFGLPAAFKGVLDDAQRLDAKARGEYTSVALEAVPRATLENYLDHIDYVVKRIGVEHVGIGTDFDHGAGIIGYKDASEAPNLTRGLLGRGYSAEDIAKIWSGNFMRVLRAAEAAATHPAQLRAVHALDEARGYCFDIPGAGPTINLEGPLQGHTCKFRGAIDDQLFELGDGGAIRASRYDRCLAAESLEAGARLFVRACERSPQQRWRLTDGRLSPESKQALCIALGSERGEIWGTPRLVTPAYRRQNLTLARCESSLETQQTFRWLPPEELRPSVADVVRTGMAPEVATALAAFGHEFDGTIAQATAKIYAPVPHVYEAAEIAVTKDLAYGPHERQHLDVHTRATRLAEAVPVVVVFHGGGLIGGSRASTVNVADYFASLGYVGVNGTYRLAPESTWPEGGRDVAAAVSWLHAHAAEYGGDPERIFVIGISTGALHTATFVFRPELVPTGSARPAGAILVSGPYTFDFAAPSPGELEYFGDDRSRWSAMVVPGNVTRTDIPVLMTTAEWDHLRYTRPFATLFEELAIVHGAVPRYFQSLGHNHSSQLLSVGTADTSVSSQIVDFIERTSGR